MEFKDKLRNLRTGAGLSQEALADIVHVSRSAIAKYELVRFEKDGLILDVNVSPSEDTAWFSLNEMCLLFGRDKSVISRHIKNLFKEGELDSKQVVAKNATTA